MVASSATSMMATATMPATSVASAAAVSESRSLEHVLQSTGVTGRQATLSL